VERGDLVLLPPGAPDTTRWREVLSPIAWSRRAQAVGARADLLRECIPHVPAGSIRQNYERALESLEREAHEQSKEEST
jgi:hypothetical protein